jgi:type IV pilus assembly protein PilB
MRPEGATTETPVPTRPFNAASRLRSPRLGDLLVEAGAITSAQLERALKEQLAWGGRLGQILLSLGFTDEVRIATAIARQLGLPAVDLDRAQLPAQVTQLLPLELAERYGLMPLGARPVEGRLLVACFDPTDAGAQAAAAKASGLVPLVHVATASSIDRAIRRHYYGEAAPTPTPGDARFNVTRNTIDPSLLTRNERDLTTRVAELEQKVEELTRALERITGPAAG